MKFAMKYILIGLGVLAGCSYPTRIAVETSPFKTQTLETKLTIAKAEPKLKICSWNIQNFGESKATNPVVMKKIATEIAKCDIIALQEISNVYEESHTNCSRNENKCPGNKNCSMIRNSLENHLNSNLKLNYKFIFSPQVKDERYLFVYNPSKVQLIESHLVEDFKKTGEVCSANLKDYGFMVREPFVGKFKAGNFEFKLMTAHTQPSNNVSELNALEMFYKQVEDEDGNKNIIALGDLNAGCSYLKKNESITFRNPRYFWVINDNEDTTVSTTTHCAYDRFVFTSSAKKYYSGKYGIETSISKEVSDHYKIWAEFRTDLKQE